MVQSGGASAHLGAHTYRLSVPRNFAPFAFGHHPKKLQFPMIIHSLRDGTSVIPPMETLGGRS